MPPLYGYQNFDQPAADPSSMGWLKNLHPELQETIKHAVANDPNITDADINNIIIQDPINRLQWMSSPGGINAGQMASVYNARGAALAPSKPDTSNLANDPNWWMGGSGINPTDMTTAQLSGARQRIPPSLRGLYAITGKKNG